MMPVDNYHATSDILVSKITLVSVLVFAWME